MTRDLTPAEAEAAVTLAAHLAAERDAPDLASMLAIAAADMIVATRHPLVWAALTNARKDT